MVSPPSLVHYVGQCHIKDRSFSKSNTPYWDRITATQTPSRPTDFVNLLINSVANGGCMEFYLFVDMGCKTCSLFKSLNLITMFCSTILFYNSGEVTGDEGRESDWRKGRQQGFMFGTVTNIIKCTMSVEQLLYTHSVANYGVHLVKGNTG